MTSSTSFQGGPLRILAELALEPRDLSLNRGQKLYIYLELSSGQGKFLGKI
jgi:hypothetical protein